MRQYENEIQLIDNTSNFISILMDMYLTARIFREFHEVNGVILKSLKILSSMLEIFIQQIIQKCLEN